MAALIKTQRTGTVRLPWAIFKPREERNLRVQFQNSEMYQEVAGLDHGDAMKVLHLSSLEGLNPEEVETRRLQFGTNEIVHEKRAYWFTQLLKAFYNPFILLLVALAVISFLTDDIPGGTIVSVMVFISVFLTFFQEHRSNRAAEKLRALVTNTVTVTRRLGLMELSSDQKPFWITRRQEIPLAMLVPGDLVHLSAGDMIPADLRLLTAKDLFISQSTLTGEALPVEKSAFTESQVSSKGLPELKNLCFMGSSVVSGTATAVAMRTGSQTYFGSIAKNIVGHRILTSFDKGINRFTWLMIRFMLVMVPLVFLINGLAKHDWLDAFMFAIAVAVGLTPEMLPMIVTVNLAKGALSMSKKKVIVKRLNSIQNFGAMDVLCTDKTGTLTQDKVILEKYVDCDGYPNDRVLAYAFLNSYHQTGLKNLLDRAVLDHVELKQNLRVQTNYRKIDEIPFDFSRRRMSVVVEENRSSHLLICKGALEEILAVSTYVEINGKTQELTSEIRRITEKVARLLNEDGLRVLAVGYKSTPAITDREYTTNDENELTLLGFIAFLDPPKETAAEAIRALNKHGITVKVLTGDNDVVTRKICREVGLAGDRILLGHEIEKMTDSELADLTETVNIFAKLNPSQKQRLIGVMQSKNHVVGFLGDGINDAPALRAADVGMSVDNAVDIAKESADIILLEKNLLVLEEGVIEGRKVFGNIVKYIKMGASSNFGNMFSVLGASLLLPFLPMLPVQLLINNLLYDLSQTAIPFDQVDEEYLTQPRRWEIGDIGRFMVFIGPISSIFDYSTFALMWFVFKANTVEKQGLFQAGWFVESLLTQTFIVHMIRTKKVPFLESRAALPLIMTTGIIMVIGILIPFSPLASKIQLVALPLGYFPYIAATLLAYACLTQIVKNWFIRKYGYN